MKKQVISHLEELRYRLIIVFSCILLMSIAGIAFSGWFINILIENLTRNVQAQFITLTPFEFIATQIKLGVFIGIVISIPVILFHTVRFIRPALRKREVKYIYTTIPVSILLFALGFIFAYAIFLKVALVFLSRLAVEYGVQNYCSINAFVTTVFTTCIIIGLVFNMPVAAFILSRIGILRRELLQSKRIYIYASSFIFAALITPPDIITQILLAIPIIILYEISMLLVKK
ncbi:twin-arginine translocase subunit TatC [Candidatus Woesearchaeota archaeon]|nr:twin-arginine translocase subunit TatC [Candidatus Woesearchaeota archaeon]